MLCCGLQVSAAAPACAEAPAGLPACSTGERSITRDSACTPSLQWDRIMTMHIGEGNSRVGKPCPCYVPPLMISNQLYKCSSSHELFGRTAHAQGKTCVGITGLCHENGLKLGGAHAPHEPPIAPWAWAPSSLWPPILHFPKQTPSCAQGGLVEERRHDPVAHRNTKNLHRHLHTMHGT